MDHFATYLYNNADYTVTDGDADSILTKVEGYLNNLWDGQGWRNGAIRNGVVVVIAGVPVAFRAFADKRLKEGWFADIEVFGHEWERWQGGTEIKWNTNKRELAVRAIDWLVDNYAANGDTMGWTERWALEDYYEEMKREDAI